LKKPEGKAEVSGKKTLLYGWREKTGVPYNSTVFEFYESRI